MMVQPYHKARNIWTYDGLTSDFSTLGWVYLDITLLKFKEHV